MSACRGRAPCGQGGNLPRLAVRIIFLALTFAFGSAAATPARDLVLVAGARSGDVRAIEATGAVVNYVRPDGIVAEASSAEQNALAGAGFGLSILAPNVTAFYGANGADGQYLTYAEFRDTMATIAANNSGICRLETLGTSHNGNLLLAMKVSDNPGTHEDEPAVHFEGDIHGDEKIGWAVAFEMLKYLVTNYGADTLVTRLVDTREIWLLPMYNPDGYIAGYRYNGDSVDLNRNWGWMWGCEWNMGDAPFSEPENRAVLGHVLRHPFVMFVSYHAGTEFISYPWSCSPDTAPERGLLDFLSNRYAVPNGYEVGQGYQGMYPINGSTKDCDYGLGMLGWSIEVNFLKTPPASQIESTFQRNRTAIMEFCHRAGQGIHGTVTDVTDGQPVHAQVWVGPPDWPNFSDATLGDYHRFRLPGTYDVTFRAPGYRDTSVNGVVVPNSGDSSVTVDMQMTPDAAAPLFGYRVIYCYCQNESYDADPKANTVLGTHDGAGYPLTTNRRLCLDMDRTVRDTTGIDLRVYRSSGSGTATIKGSNSWQGPWTTIGIANTAQTDFDIDSVGLDSVRYIEITSSGTFNIDAVEGTNDYVGVTDQATDHRHQAPCLSAQSPARGSVRFTLTGSAEAGTRLLVRAATGRLVYSTPVIRDSSLRLDLRSMPAGVYFATLNTRNTAPVQFVVTK